jgi:hypothetical protein
MATEANQASKETKAFYGALFGLSCGWAALQSPLVGGLAATAVFAVMQRKGFNPIDSASAAWSLIAQEIDEAAPSAEINFDAVRLVSKAVQQTPLSKYLEFDLAERHQINADWIVRAFTLNNHTKRVRSLGLMGEPGDGKTMLQRYLIYLFLRQNPDGEVYVHDSQLQYHLKENPDFWLGLEQGKHLFITPAELVSLVDKVRRRVLEASPIPTLLVIDEFNNTLPLVKESQRDSVLEGLRAIKDQGGKHRIQFVLSTQAGSVGEAGINQAFMRSLDWCIFRQSLLTGGIIRNLGLRDKAQDAFKRLSDELEGMPLEINGHRPVITYLDKEIELNGVPDLSGLPKRIELLSPDDEGKAWLKSIFATYPDVATLIETGGITSRSALIDHLNPILKRAGQKAIRRDDSDFRNVALKDNWAEILEGNFWGLAAQEDCTAPSPEAVHYEG